MLLSFEQALATEREKLNEAGLRLATENLPLDQARGRVLAEEVVADRDYPPFNRSTRDGYALRSSEVGTVPVTLHCLGELRAGESFSGALGPGKCVQIMTGAPVPAGADAVVMLEYVRASGSEVEILRTVSPGENVVPRGSEATAGSPVLPRGRRLGPGEMGLLASVGKVSVEVFRRPSVAILPTGDEIVPLDQQPEWFQVRNSNAVILTAQVTAAGGVARLLGIAPDQKTALRKQIEQGLQSDLLLLSGGVSMGKYDLVQRVLDELGAEFFFQSVAIRPGKPLVFGRIGGRFFFGLPGNPVSTYVTFELFVRPAIGVLQGAAFETPIYLRARMGSSFRQKLGLTAFMPARVEVQSNDPVVNPVAWQGSGDLVGMAQANCLLVAHPEQTELATGDWVDVLPKRW
jgi:molybdopterin molybdotransferase